MLETGVCRAESGTQGSEGYCRKKAIAPDEQRELARYVMQAYELSERQACRLVSLSGSVFRYEAKSTDDHELVQELLRLAEHQPRWGCGKMVDYLRNQGYS